MALLDISLVTQALINLIQFSFKASDIWNPEGNCNSPRVSPQPPDKLFNESVGLYLYHITEERIYKNLPITGNDTPIVHDDNHVPMELALYYQLTAYSDIQTDCSTLNEQKMLGIAIKALHDHPVIDNKTKIIDLERNTHQVFPSELCDDNNKLIIELLQVDISDVIRYWSTWSKPLRLSLYYKVRVKMVN